MADLIFISFSKEYAGKVDDLTSKAHLAVMSLVK